MAALAELTARATLRGEQFKSEVRSLGNSVDSLKSNQLAGLKSMIAGAFTVGAIVQFGRKMLAMADDVQTAASTFGITVNSLLTMKGVMAESGIGADKFIKLFARIGSAASEAKNGVKTYTDAFKAMGIAQDDLAGLSPDKIIELMAVKYAEAGNKAEFFSGVVKAFGLREGPALIEVLQRIHTEGLDKFRESAGDAAKGITELAKASDTLEKAGNQVQMWAAKVVGAITTVSEKAGAMSTRATGGWKRNLVEYGKMLVNPVYAAKKIGGYFGELSATEAPAMDEKPVIDAAANTASELAAIAARQAEEAKKVADAKAKAEEAAAAKALAAWKTYYDAIDRETEKLVGIYEEQDALALDTQRRQQEIIQGKGISTDPAGRVDALQRIGGIIGGVSAGGDSAARRAERVEKIQQALKDEAVRSQAELVKMNQKLDELVGGVE
jgi:hypothetical protein